MIALALALAAVSPPVVTVDGGAIRGEQGADRVSFRGVPFAAPPVGPLRWRPPVPVARWAGVRDATRSAPSCAQLDDGWNKANAANSAEDCLYLEVATPSLAPPAPLPVLVWVHGGSNKAGGAAGTIATSLVKRGIVVVSIQYRLGPLGFMAHPALTAESPARASGNYGLMDQQAALAWVRRNIARFGGDPARVTIGGESAGAQDVGLQQLSPAARGLFGQAIEESGTAGFGLPARDLRRSEAIGEQIAGLAGAPHATVAQLRALPVDRLLAAARRVSVPDLPDPGTVWLQATVDGAVLTEPPAATLARGGGAHVPLLIGSNAREIDFFPTPAAARAALPAYFGARAGEVARLYGLDRAAAAPDDPERGGAPTQVGTDVTFTCPTQLIADAATRAGAPVWRYDFAYDPAGGPRLSHASELRYVFGHPGEDGIPADAPALQAYWADFIRAGDPNGSALRPWPRYGEARAFLRFGVGAPAAGEGLRADICRGWTRP